MIITLSLEIILVARRSHAPLCDHKVIYTQCYQKLDAPVLEDMLVDGVWYDVLYFDNIDDSVECFNYYCFAMLVIYYYTYAALELNNTPIFGLLPAEFLLRDGTEINFTIVLFFLVLLQTSNCSAKLKTKLIICLNLLNHNILLIYVSFQRKS